MCRNNGDLTERKNEWQTMNRRAQARQSISHSWDMDHVSTPPSTKSRGSRNIAEEDTGHSDYISYSWDVDSTCCRRWAQYREPCNFSPAELHLLALVRESRSRRRDDAWDAAVAADRMDSATFWSSLLNTAHCEKFL